MDMCWTLVTPREAASSMARSMKRRRCAKSNGGTALSSNASAASLSTPVGSPEASRTMTPPGGSGVLDVMPAAASAFEFASTADPFALRCMRSIVGHALHEFLQAGGVGELHRAQLGAALREVHVRVVKTRYEAVALGIDNARARPLPLRDLCLGPDSYEAAIEDRERVGLRLLRVHGPDARIAHDEIRRRVRAARLSVGG